MKSLIITLLVFSFNLKASEKLTMVYSNNKESSYTVSKIYIGEPVSLRTKLDLLINCNGKVSTLKTTKDCDFGNFSFNDGVFHYSSYEYNDLDGSCLTKEVKHRIKLKKCEKVTKKCAVYKLF